MTETEIAVKLTALEHETKSAKHRLDDLEVQNQAIQDLALSVKELTINMSNMIEEQRKQGKRLNDLEKEPAQQWGRMKQKVIDTIIGALAGAVATGLIYVILQSVK